jgi:hypothetical protein
MKKRKAILSKKETRKNKSKIKKVSSNSREVKNLTDRKFGKDPAFKKRIVVKEDGRYLIYYDFNM